MMRGSLSYSRKYTDREMYFQQKKGKCLEDAIPKPLSAITTFNKHWPQVECKADENHEGLLDETFVLPLNAPTT